MPTVTVREDQAVPETRGGEDAIAVSIERVGMTFARKGHAVRALDNVDLTIRKGEFVAVLGPSGCGKSTLLKLLSGLRAPTEGRIELFGQPVTGPRADVGIVFQSPVLLPWRSVLENVMLPIDVLRLDRDVHRRKARALLELVGLDGFENAYPQELSGGMQQRAAIARALVYDAPILLMDEPFGALDAMTRDQMNVEVQRIWSASRKTVLFITHSIAEAVFLADRVVVMSPRPGRILKILDVPIPRLRTLDDMLIPEFGALVREIRAMFGGNDAAHAGDRSKAGW